MKRENVLKWYITISRGADCEVQRRLLERLKKTLVRMGVNA